jgi:hypothetical protein
MKAVHHIIAGVIWLAISFYILALCGCSTAPVAPVVPVTTTAPVPPMPGGVVYQTQTTQESAIIPLPQVVWNTNIIEAFFVANYDAFVAGTLTPNALGFFAVSPDLQGWTTAYSFPYPEVGTRECFTNVFTNSAMYYRAGIQP